MLFPKIEAETANEVQQPLGICERFHLSALDDDDDDERCGGN